MRIVKVKGGLGNQMFQYAFAKYLAEYTKEEVKMDFTSYNQLLNDRVRKPRLKSFRLSLKETSDQDIDNVCIFDHRQDSLSFKYKALIGIERMLNPKYYFEKNREYRRIESISQYIYFDGYWQSWRYVEPIINDLIKEFQPNYNVSDVTRQMINKVAQENSVFIGVRKGDYDAEKGHYGCFEQKYYDQALSIIESQIENPVYYIFSNDIEWTKANLHFGNRSVIYREDADVVDDFEELLIMANCKHSIIVNSTYHWWAARLGYSQEKIVIAPKRWFFDNKPIDIVPPNWITI